MTDDTPEDITFHFIKSNFFRVVHVDGAWGGITPQAKIHVDFYSERQPIPRSITSTVTDGRIGQEVRDSRESKEGIIREVEVGLVMDVAVAEQVIIWLQDRVTMAKNLVAESKAEGRNKDV